MGLKQQNSISHSSGACKSKLKVLEDPVSSHGRGGGGGDREREREDTHTNSLGFFPKGTNPIMKAPLL